MPKTGMGGDLLPSLWRLGGALLVVLVLAWGTLWLARRVLKGHVGSGNGSVLRVLHRVYIAPRRSIELVAVGPRILVLGVTEHQISFLTELTREELSDHERSSAGVVRRGIAGNHAVEFWRAARRKLGSRLGMVHTAGRADIPHAETAAEV